MIYVLGGLLVCGFVCYACCCVAHDADIRAEQMHNEHKRKTDTKNK